MSGLRFAVLHHTAWPGRPDHYDLLLQVEPGASDDAHVLKAFATLTDEFPQGEEVRLQQLPDHRRIYLALEGPVAGGRGQVQRVDEGECAFLPAGQDRSRCERSPSEIHVRLSGTRLKGLFVLRNLEGWLYSMSKFPRLPSPSPV
jgi:hypothetical protein